MFISICVFFAIFCIIYSYRSLLCNNSFLTDNNNIVIITFFYIYASIQEM